MLLQSTNCHGAMNGLMAVVLEDRIRTHLVDADSHEELACRATEEPI